MAIASSTSGSSPAEEASEPVRIGAGSFGAVWVQRGDPFVAKIVHHHANIPVLLKEYIAHSEIYLSCSSDSFFAIPVCLGFYAPDDGLLVAPCTLGTAVNRRFAPVVTKDSFYDFDISTAAYMMERVYSLKSNARNPIRAAFYPEVAKGQPAPSLCRLYFGKVIALPSGPGPRFFSSANFPLDVARYNYLRQKFANLGRALPSPEQIAYGMGEMLGRIHWRGGYDGRDIEFVMGGDGMGGVTFWVFDFNQMRQWTKNIEEVHVLVEAFFSNDPYYPRPRLDDPFYLEFQRGYSEAYPPAYADVSRAFLVAVAEEQSKRDMVGIQAEANGKVSKAITV